MAELKGICETIFLTLKGIGSHIGLAELNGIIRVLPSGWSTRLRIGPRDDLHKVLNHLFVVTSFAIEANEPEIEILNIEDLAMRELSDAEGYYDPFSGNADVIVTVNVRQTDVKRRIVIDFTSDSRLLSHKEDVLRKVYPDDEPRAVLFKKSKFKTFKTSKFKTFKT
jgi:hypothetical protein